MSRPTPSFYNLAWRWHFYAGLFVAPFMILLALTGIIYLFKPQLDPLLYDHLLTVTPAITASAPTSNSAACKPLTPRAISASTCRRSTANAAASS
jgi:Uncharacterized iron-regulated membrane protein